MQAPRPLASPGWVQIPLWGTSQPWGAGRARHRAGLPHHGQPGPGPALQGEGPRRRLLPGAGWVWLANTHWDTGSRLRVSGARLPGPPAVTEILQVLGAPGCNSAVFAQSLMAPVFPCGSGLGRETERCGEPGGRVEWGRASAEQMDLRERARSFGLGEAGLGSLRRERTCQARRAAQRRVERPPAFGLGLVREPGRVLPAASPPHCLSWTEGLPGVNSGNPSQGFLTQCHQPGQPTWRWAERIPLGGGRLGPPHSVMVSGVGRTWRCEVLGGGDPPL